MKNDINPLDVLARMTGTPLNPGTHVPFFQTGTEAPNLTPDHRGLYSAREQVREFRPVARTLRSIDTALAPVKHFVTRYGFRHHVAHLLTEMLKHSPGLPGQRDVAMAAFRSRLKGLELYHVAFSDICASEFRSVFSRQTNTVSLEGLVLPSDLDNLAGVHYLRFVHALGIVADTVYDSAGEAYVPAHPDLNGLHAVSRSEYYPTDLEQPMCVRVTTTLHAEPLPPGVTLLQVLGVEFLVEPDDFDDEDENADPPVFEWTFGPAVVLNVW